MGLTVSVPTIRRWQIVIVMLAVTLLGWVPTAQAQRSFTADAGLIFNTIKPDKTADFEMVMGKLKEALQMSEDPARQEMADGWKVYKSVEPGPSGNVLYIWIMDPAVPTGDYTVSKILADAFPVEVQDLYQKFSDAYASGQNLVNLQLVQSFGISTISYWPPSARPAPSNPPSEALEPSGSPASGNLTAAQRNAVRSANSYLQLSGFSRQGLIDRPAVRSGPRNLDSGLSEISIVFQAAVPKLVASK